MEAAARDFARQALLAAKKKAELEGRHFDEVSYEIVFLYIISYLFILK